jgi:hypothetical protein
VEPVSELFNLDTDPSERLDIAAAHPDIVTRLRARMDALRTEFRSEQSAAVTAARGFHELSSPLD